MIFNIKTDQRFSPELHCALRAAESAGEYVLGNFDRFYTAEVKEDNKGLVTEYDRQSEQMIREELLRHFSYPMLGEEYGHHTHSGASGQSDSYLWCVDPIDGTANFFHRLPFFTISIALLHNNDSQVGVVYQPTTQQCYFAEKGKGAFLNGTAIHVSTVANPAQAVLLINHGYREADHGRCVQVLQRLGRHYESRKFGTTALELAWLAQGLAEAFLCSGDEMWDYAAGMLLVREAGGRVTDWKGREFDGTTSCMCASNGIFHRRLVDAVKDLQDGDDAMQDKI